MQRRVWCRSGELREPRRPIPAAGAVSRPDPRRLYRSYSGEGAPDFRVYAGRAELGAAWKAQTNGDEPRDYLGVQLDDRSFPEPVRAVSVKVFDVAKTVADCFRHRNKVGLSVAIEGLQETLRQRKATPAEIARQAERGGVSTVIRPYLEALTVNA